MYLYIFLLLASTFFALIDDKVHKTIGKKWTRGNSFRGNLFRGARFSREKATKNVPCVVNEYNPDYQKKPRM